MIAILSGGTGTPKLIQGFMSVIDQEALSIIVNTSEDKWLPHGYFSPDIDTVMYTLAEIVDDESWHGIKGDTYHTHDTLKKMGASEFLRIGDRDRAMHIWRGEKMRAGNRLSEVSKEQGRKLGIKAQVLPMTDDKVETVIESKDGAMDLHEFWVHRKGNVEVKSVQFKGLESARPAQNIIDVIDRSDRIILGPSNPVTSIYPIIAIQDVRNALVRNRKKVIGVSPLIGGRAVSGPAEKLMRAFGLDRSIDGLVSFYKEILSYFVVDRGERMKEFEDIDIIESDILMNDIESKKSLAKFILDIEI